MKVSSRILLATLAATIALPFVASAAKGDRKNKKDESATPSFATVDKSNDGTISEKEFCDATKEKLGGEENAKKRFESLDKDGNGKLSKEEFEAGNSAAKKKRKKNAN